MRSVWRRTTRYLCGAEPLVLCVKGDDYVGKCTEYGQDHPDHPYLSARFEVASLTGRTHKANLPIRHELSQASKDCSA